MVILFIYGVKLTPTDVFALAKGYFAAFQYWEYVSGVVATPWSAIPPERASGAILRKGAPVNTGRMFVRSWE